MAIAVLKPDWANYLRPDEIAECWDGVFSNQAVPDLYEQLWGLMSNVADIPNIEDSGPADHVGHGNIGDFWDKLPEATQLELVRLDSIQPWREHRQQVGIDSPHFSLGHAEDIDGVGLAKPA